MRQIHRIVIWAVAACLALTTPLIALADGDDSPHEDHRSVVVDLPEGSRAAVEAATGANSVIVNTRIDTSGSRAPEVDGVPSGSRGRGGPGGGGGGGATGGNGGQSTAPRPPATLCPGQTCETGPDGTLRTIPGGAVPGLTFYTAPPPVTPISGWTPVGSAPGIDVAGASRAMVQEVRLPDITIRTNPLQGVVAIPTWYWVDGYDGDTLSDTRTLSESHEEVRDVEVPALDGGPAQISQETRTVRTTTTVSIRVAPVEYSWNFGDGTTGQQLSGPEGLGTPFRGANWPSTVQHTYDYSSIDFASGFPIQLTVRFSVAVQVNGGQWNRLDDIVKTYGSSYLVRQVQPLRLTIDSTPRLGAP